MNERVSDTQIDSLMQIRTECKNKLQQIESEEKILISLLKNDNEKEWG